MERTFLHIDMDSFFASVEQQSNPFLRGKPVGVIKEKGRTCIIASSREAKKKGIKTGTNVFEARRICPEIVLVPANFEKYFSVTQKFIEICSRYSWEVEVFSIDEVFLEVTQTKKFFGGVSGIVRKIKEEIKKEIGEYITCSIGISYNRILAKLASGIKKPDGVFEITPENRDEILLGCRLSDVCGIGPRIEKRLFEMGISDFRTLREIPIEYLEASFGKFWAQELKKLAWGEEVIWVEAEKAQMKSVSRTFTLYEETRNWEEIRRVLRNLCEEAALKARMMREKGRVVGVGIRGGLDKGVFKRKTLKYFLDDGGELFEEVWKLVKEARWEEGVRFLGVWLGDLQPKEKITRELFADEKREKLREAVDKVNARFGDFTVYPGVLLGGKIIRREVGGFLGDKNFWLGGEEKLGN